MTKTRRAGLAKKRRRGGRKTIRRRGGKRKSRVTRRGGKRRSRAKRRGGKRRSRIRKGGNFWNSIVDGAQSFDSGLTSTVEDTWNDVGHAINPSWSSAKQIREKKETKKAIAKSTAAAVTATAAAAAAGAAGKKIAAASERRVAAAAKKRLQEEKGKYSKINDGDDHYTLYDENKATAAEEEAGDIIGDVGDLGGGRKKNRLKRTRKKKRGKSTRRKKNKKGGGLFNIACSAADMAEGGYCHRMEGIGRQAVDVGKGIGGYFGHLGSAMAKDWKADGYASGRPLFRHP